MRQYKALLFDLDDTIFDFRKGEINSICTIFDQYGIDKTEENINTYININIKYWQKLEKKEMTKQEILEGRFKETFEILHGPKINPELVNRDFLEHLSHEAYYMDGALEMLDAFKKKGYHLYIISNGITFVQEGRLKIRYELLDYIEECFISDKIGYEKPDKRFMDYVLNKIPFKEEDCLIIGDSLTSDMMLGVNSGIDTIWFNARGKVLGENDLHPKITIYHLKDLLEIL